MWEFCLGVDKESFVFIILIIMITLEQLTRELDVHLIDEVIGGRPGTWWDPWTTAGGTSGIHGITDTTAPHGTGCWFCGSDGV